MCLCASSGWQPGTWLPEPSLALTLGDLPTHDKATWGTTGVSTQGLSRWPGQLLPYPESSPGGDHSLAPPRSPGLGLLFRVG